jgi:hypothetical protein
VATRPAGECKCCGLLCLQHADGDAGRLKAQTHCLLPPAADPASAVLLLHACTRPACQLSYTLLLALTAAMA